MGSSSDFERLSPAHERLIRDSAISDSVQRARGYRTVRSKAELERLGFGKAQRQVPGLLIPVISVHGGVAFHQLRPDNPRLRRDKPVKYETPSGVRMVLDVHPFAHQQIGNPDTPLFITEGCRKADAAVSIRLCCVALLGVWNWRGTNDRGGKVALSDWESVALAGRSVYIAFDSDVMLKSEVQDALARLKAFLESRKANVSLIYLPPQPDGSKIGLDDFIAAGHDVENLLRLASSKLLEPNVDTKSPSFPYRVERGRICIEKETRHGPVIEPLANFDARVREELVLDDGEEQRREFLISCTLDSGKALPDARVPVERFSSMAWVPTSWGNDAVPAAGLGKKDQLREGIQLLSGNPKRRRIFTHSGWHQVDGQFVYLTASGAAGARGVEVELGSELSRYSTPLEPQGIVGAVRESLRLLDIAPLTVVAPLWAGVYRAPLASAYPLDLSLWMEGITGSLKSTIAALFLCHWGNFTRTTLPGAWSSTANQLEKRAHVLKDALFVIDDYAPNALDRREMESKAARLLRSQGNRSGRGRLTSDLVERRAFYPRGLILSTGEQLPPGQSILARTFVVDVNRDDVVLDQLTERQGSADRLSHGFGGYLAWLAPQMDGLPATLGEAFEKARANSAQEGTHLRHPEALAHLWLGLDCGLSFALEIGAVDAAEAEDLRVRCWEAMLERAAEMGRIVDEERPAKRFAEILATLIVQGRIVLQPREAFRPVPRDDHFAGWHDADYLYLLPAATFRSVSQFARESGEPLPVSRRTLQQDLVKGGIADHAEGRTTTTVRAAGTTRRVLRLKKVALTSLIGEPFPDSGGGVTDVTDVTGSGE